MSDAGRSLLEHILGRTRQVREFLGQGPEDSVGPDARFGDLLDSMGLVELVAFLAEDFAVEPEVIEQCIAGRFGTIAELADALSQAGLSLPKHVGDKRSIAMETSSAASSVILLGPGPTLSVNRAWLTATVARLPGIVQPAAKINLALQRPAGWLEQHAGIFQRGIWGDEDPIEASASAAEECLEEVGVSPEQVGGLLVTSEAPPLLTGLAAALHYRLGLPLTAVALEVGGACTGFLAALWTAQALLPRLESVLIIAVESPSRYLSLQPGPPGEAAALFGDGAAACLVCDKAIGPFPIPIADIRYRADGSHRQVVRVERSVQGAFELRLDRQPLASHAIRIMEQAALGVIQAHGLRMSDIRAVVAHGGNGRMPPLLARRLGLSPERILSETARTGNLGSASLPVAWAARPLKTEGPVVWTAMGAGLTWGAALTGIVAE